MTRRDVKKNDSTLFTIIHKMIAHPHISYSMKYKSIHILEMKKIKGIRSH